MAHRILTHTAAALGGAVLASAVCYGLVTQGYLPTPQAPQGDLRGAKEAILDHLRKECGKEGLRGAFVDSVDERGDQLFVAGTLDQPGQEPRMIEAATAALDSNQAEWGRFFKKRPPVGEFTTYPLRSKLLPELRKLFEVGGEDVPKDSIGRVWIEDVFSDAKGRLRVLGTALVPTGTDPEEGRSRVQQVVAKFLRQKQNLRPDAQAADGKAVEPVLSEADFQVVPGLRQKLASAVAGRKVSVWGLSFDVAGTPVVKVLREPMAPADDLMAALMPPLTEAGLLAGGRKFQLVEVRVDANLASELRKKLADGEDRLGQQTRLDAVEVKAGDNLLAVICKGVCVHGGKDDTVASRRLLQRLLVGELKVEGSDLEIDLGGVKARPRMVAEVRALLLNEPDGSELAGVRVTGVRFDPAGRLMLESPSEPALVKEVQALVEKKLLPAKPAVAEEQEEFVAAYAEPPRADTPPVETRFQKIRRVLAKNLKDPDLRYFRLDQESRLDLADRPFIAGVSLIPLEPDERKKFAKRVHDGPPRSRNRIEAPARGGLDLGRGREIRPGSGQGRRESQRQGRGTR
jgi:hypothetical protein